MNIDFESLKKTISSYKDRRVLLTFHAIGDTDSISSAFALLLFFKNARIASPDFITSNSKNILESMQFKESAIQTNFDDNAELAVLLDVNNFEDCGKFRQKLEGFKGTILVIDHHTPNKIEKEDVLVFNDESYNSAASIVYDLAKSLNVRLDSRTANLLATGILSDSAELRNAFPKTFIQIGELLQRSGTDYQSLLLEMQHVASPKARAEFMADLFKCKVEVHDGLLMLYGSARVHANKLADDAIKIGADVALFHSINRKEVSFSARLRPPLDNTYKINLGKIMKKLAPIINGQGGGHPCAAGAYGNGVLKENEFQEAFMKEISARTGKHQ